MPRLSVPRLVATLTLAAVAIAVPGAPPALADTAASSSPAPSWQPLREPGVGGAVTALSISPRQASRILVGGDMLGIGVSQDGGASWQPGFGLDSYEVAGFTWDPSDADRVWASTMSGPYLSQDGGHTWAPRRQGLPAVADWAYSAPIQQIVFDPADERHLYAFSGSLRGWSAPGTPPWGTVWESRDDGASWTTLSRLPGQAPVQSVVALAGDDLLAAGRSAGLFRSPDGGRSWAAVPGSTAWDVRELVADPAAPQNVWLSTGSDPTTEAAPVGGVLRSTDGGRTWTASTNGLSQAIHADANLRSRFGGLHRSTTGRLYVSDNSWSVAAVYASDDDGRTWTKLVDNASRPTSAYNSGLGMAAISSSADGRSVIAGNQESLFSSTDAGRTWRDSSIEEVSPGFTRGRGYSGLVSSSVRFNPSVAGDVSLTAMDGGNVIQSVDGGSSWRRSMCAWDCWSGAYDVHYGPGGTSYALLGQAGMFNGLARSQNGGRTWTVAVGAAAGLPERWSWAGGTPGGVWAVDATTVVATVGGRVYRSTDGGARWAPVTSGGSGFLTGAPSQRSRLYLSSTQGLQTSTDGGATFQLLSGVPHGGIDGQLTVSPVDPRVVYVPQWRSGGGALWRYDGTTATRVLADNTVYAVAVQPQNPDVLVAVSNDHPFHDVVRGGVQLSTDGGATWTSVVKGLPVLRVSAAAFDPFAPGRLIIGTYGRGFFTTELSADGAAAAAESVPVAPVQGPVAPGPGPAVPVQGPAVPVT
ncbi:MAG: Ycf48-like protein, partial [Frankiales bacterium]|nr:Ycf48-like protein [Frankiales bacterium]